MSHYRTKYYETYGDFIREGQRQLTRFLRRNNISQDIIHEVVMSGYYLLNDTIMDGFYGSKTPFGIISKKAFIEYLKSRGKSHVGRGIQKIKINSLKQAIDFLSVEDRCSHFFNDGRMSFRGQSKRHEIQRSIPNPFFSNNGREDSLVPSIWRSYTRPDSINKRPTNPYHSVLNIDTLIYMGLDIPKILQRNASFYDVFVMSDLEDSSDMESRELYRRWSSHCISAPGYHEIMALEQHYGIDTLGLDITFDLATALFFATHKFERLNNGKATYVPVENTGGSVVYCMVFREPPISKTNDMINKLEVFSHIPPLRPLRQSCALPIFNFMNINEAATELHVILELDEHFDRTGLPDAKSLFPNREEDKFYDALLKLKAQQPESFKGIVEYEL